ncbi:hypothetical protein [Opacimonas viscosa]|uniref:Uncharacterized protein n=1 Tax=Opacimonas viscosa TaxID=2961944 RepID=A0AA42BND6_9ALTE|nr:hypothetical protein [Opacimonas viscosa]MCP3429562.1 hypothetical protein [Opacimonas viscosa]
MKELNANEIQEVNGGAFVAAYWVVKGAVHAYRTYKVVEKVTDAAAGIAAGEALFGEN